MEPSGIALFSLTNSLYIADTNNNAIRRFDTVTHVVTTFAGVDSYAAVGLLDGIGTQARFRLPRGVAVDSNGYIFVADSGNFAVRMISSSGQVSTIAGGYPTAASGHVDGVGTFSRFGLVYGVSCGSAGELWIGDAGVGVSNSSIRQLSYPFSAPQFTLSPTASPTTILSSLAPSPGVTASPTAVSTSIPSPVPSGALTISPAPTGPVVASSTYKSRVPGVRV